MTTRPPDINRTILFGVTSSQSLKLLGKIPCDMADMGWNVHVVAGDIESEVSATPSGVELHTLPMVRSPSPLNDLHSLVGWILLLRGVKPAIVVIGTPKAAFLGLIASAICRVSARVYHLRGLRLQTVSGLARLVLFLVEWVTAKCSTKTLAVSNSLKAEYSRLGLSKTNKIEVLGLGSSHGVDVNYFHPTRWSTWEPPEPKLRQASREGILVLGFVGRFSRDKGAQELVRCSHILLKSGIPHILLIIGPVEGEKEALNELQRLNPNTVITGSVEEVAPYYSVMDLLVLPTHREGFPNAVLEAAASGVPAVTTNATGAIDSVVDGQTGIVVPARNGDALAAKVIELITDAKLLQEMGLNARNWVVSHFSSDLVTRNHSVYLTQIASSKLPPE